VNVLEAEESAFEDVPWMSGDEIKKRIDQNCQRQRRHYQCGLYR
jgi:hypothetical protein